MPNISARNPAAGLSVLLLAATLAAQTTDEAATSPQVSKVRIVRLSQVKGDVQLDRNTGRGFEAAMANLPIVEKSRLKTGTGVAEVEFEDNSSLRLAPDSILEFPQLERSRTGLTISSVQLVKGTAYVSLVKTSQENEFNLMFSDRKLKLLHASHVRLQLDGAEAKFAVLDGIVRIDGADGPIDVAKKKTVTFSLQDQAQPMIAKNISADPFDTWDQNATGYHARTAAYTAMGSTPYSYGTSEMTYYGSFVNAAGCGSMWRPYFASAAWDPFSNGTWAWYPNAGYSWVSPYPWGWTPYHYGSWTYCPSAGWGWQPGGSWNGLNNIALNMPRGVAGHGPTVPIRPPVGNEPTLTDVNLRPAVLSHVDSESSFLFRKDSAGLGIPRDGLGKLDRLSEHAIAHGTASTNIYFTDAPSATVNGRTRIAAINPGSVHAGFPPPSSGITPSERGSASVAGASKSGPSIGLSSGRASARAR